MKKYNANINIKDNLVLSVDQATNGDLTNLTFFKIKEGKFIVIDSKFIEPRENIEEYINKVVNDMRKQSGKTILML